MLGEDEGPRTWTAWQNVVKLLRAVDLLSAASGATSKTLEKELEVARESVFRMKKRIEALGIAIEELETGDILGGDQDVTRWKIPGHCLVKLGPVRLPDLNLSLSEMIALLLLKAAAGPLAATTIAVRLDDTFEALSAHLPEKTLAMLQRAGSLLHATDAFAKDYSGKEEIIEVLTDALLGHKTCYVKYDSFHKDAEVNFKIDPLYFFEHLGGYYLLVRATTFGDIRTLAVERIVELTPTGDGFRPPADFDPAAELAGAFGVIANDPFEAKLWVSKDKARYVRERALSGNQTIKEQDDGSIILELKTSGRHEFKHWVMSLGSAAKLEAPRDLRDEIIRDLACLRGMYEK